MSRKVINLYIIQRLYVHVWSCQSTYSPAHLLKGYVHGVMLSVVLRASRYVTLLQHSFNVTNALYYVNGIEQSLRKSISAP